MAQRLQQGEMNQLQASCEAVSACPAEVDILIDTGQPQGPAREAWGWTTAIYSPIGSESWCRCVRGPPTIGSVTPGSPQRAGDSTT